MQIKKTLIPRAVKKQLALVHTTSLARQRVEPGSLPSKSGLLPITPWLHLRKIAHVEFSRKSSYVISKTYSLNKYTCLLNSLGMMIFNIWQTELLKSL